ncbi:uncharacterized protein BO80DRAFT_189302 [Aspergillus ibericus CBS 121593]|uniref:Uncharacterized protein n=1 Tax=Aspergillus ibericus CBS 121593 TaxID=1448316 RepID=A0A395GPP3_9EURO|nr:hypothetical protein BO80DRAFT_189302 [Aspergillus ibericus CBS 121593]RAK97465.1 hypothetical protein BO80DRAFT_189302 [Aspergillus ibericus CBS 121593]
MKKNGGNFIGLADRPRSTGVAIESLTHSFFSALRIILPVPAPMSSRPPCSSPSSASTGVTSGPAMATQSDDELTLVLPSRRSSKNRRITSSCPIFTNPRILRAGEPSRCPDSPDPNHLRHLEVYSYMVGAFFVRIARESFH